MPTYVRTEKNYDAEVVITRWGMFSKLVADRLREALQHFLEYYGKEAIVRYMPKGGSGKLADDIKIYDESTLHQIVFRIGVDDPEAKRILSILEHGSPPHTITVRNADALSFLPVQMRFYMGPNATVPAKILGQRTFANSVEHPGNRPYRMFEQGMNDIDMEIRVVVNKIVRETLNEIVRIKQ